MKKMKKIVVVMMVIIAICLLGMLEVKATSDNPIAITNIELTIPDTNTNATADPNSTNTNTSQIIQPTTNTNTNGNGNTLPKTGVTEDITVMFFIVVCAVSAIYAYKKIRDYNN